MAMRALTLHQPWASLIADGRKRCETRSWAPALKHVGQPLAIHAGRHMDRDFAHLAYQASGKWNDLPRGAVVAVAILRCAFQVKEHHWSFSNMSTLAIPERVVGPRLDPTDYPRVDRFGDWSPGRWIWMLSDIARLVQPVRMRGHQGVWRVDDEESVRRYLPQEATL